MEKTERRLGQLDSLPSTPLVELAKWHSNWRIRGPGRSIQTVHYPPYINVISPSAPHDHSQVKCLVYY